MGPWATTLWVTNKVIHCKAALLELLQQALHGRSQRGVVATVAPKQLGFEDATLLQDTSHRSAFPPHRMPTWHCPHSGALGPTAGKKLHLRGPTTRGMHT